LVAATASAVEIEATAVDLALIPSAERKTKSCEKRVSRKSRSPILISADVSAPLTTVTQQSKPVKTNGGNIPAINLILLSQNAFGPGGQIELYDLRFWFSNHTHCEAKDKENTFA